MIDSGVLPAGAVQLICGGVADLFDHLSCQDVIAFTGSASTALKLRQHPQVLANAVRFTAETDSLNCSILGADAGPGVPELDLFVREVVREMTAKAGQKCTAIRRALVPAAVAPQVLEALRAALGRIIVGDPRLESVRMGPVASLSQRREVLEQLVKLEREAQLICGGAGAVRPLGADADRGAFLAPTLLYCKDPAAAGAVHSVEAFGPVCTVVPYETTAEAIALARRGGGSLAASVFTGDDALAAQLVRGLAPYHGRIVVVNRHSAKESTGHGSPLPHLVHGGPGRAGGGEEMGGIRGVMHYMQRTAVQGSPDVITQVTGRWTRGSRELAPGTHPFRKSFGALAIGDTFHSAERTVSIEDIERFAELSGDRFYAHMDEIQAARNPFFGGRVAHGYFLISAAAGLFVDPPFGPVLANYGIDGLRFLKPVKPGDRIKVRLTCRRSRCVPGQATARCAGTPRSATRTGMPWPHDVLTMVSEKQVPDA
jgi:oxepin-CoA hydrolase/3-oxo-5,6-dehydrosuberyl-CoA semialdehyde dehydrogenase